MGKLLTLLAVGAAVIAMAVASLIPASFRFYFATIKASPDETMTAIVYDKHGDVSVLRYDTAFPKPIPSGDHQYLIHVHASALNPVDFKLRRNTNIPKLVVPLPKIPGGDIAGVVVQAPAHGKGKFQVGDRVAALIPYIACQWGALAEYVVVAEPFLAKMGPTTSFEAAASYPLVGLTVLQQFHKLDLDEITSGKSKKKLLVHAGAGGVGSFAIQYGKHLGMHVSTTASAPKAALLKELGADVVIDYRTQLFEDGAKDEPYDVILDPMSWLYEERSFSTNVLKPSGHYLNVPGSDWALGEDGNERANGFLTVKNLVRSKLWNWIRPGAVVPKYSFGLVEPNGSDMQLILDMMEAGTIRPVIDQIYHLSEAAKAYEYLEPGHATGKVVLYHGDKRPPPPAEETTTTSTTTTNQEPEQEAAKQEEEDFPKEEPVLEEETMENAEEYPQAVSEETASTDGGHEEPTPEDISDQQKQEPVQQTVPIQEEEPVQEEIPVRQEEQVQEEVPEQEEPVQQQQEVVQGGVSEQTE